MIHETHKTNGKLKEAQYLQGQIAGMASDIVDGSVEKAYAAAEYVGDRVDVLKDSGVRAVKKAETRIKTKPGQSIAIAFGAGVLAALLLGRKWS